MILRLFYLCLWVAVAGHDVTTWGPVGLFRTAGWLIISVIVGLLLYQAFDEKE